MAETRVPTPQNRGWSLETAIDYLLGMISAQHTELLDQRAELMTLITSNDRRYEERFISQKEAIEKAERATEKRFESVNEFRGTLDQQQRTLIPRSEVQEIRNGFQAELNNLMKMIDELKVKESNRRFERRGVAGGWGYAVGAVGLILAILGLASRFIGQ